MAKRRGRIGVAESILATETAQSQIARALDHASTVLRGHLDADLRANVVELGLESPIEVAFYAWWQAIQRVTPDCHVTLAPQQEVALPSTTTYRLDFVVDQDDTDAGWEASQAGIDWPQIAIELDGHDWHERTKDQVILRNQRDRDLQTAGWKIFHVSGTELLRDPVSVVAEIMAFTDGAYWDWHRRLRRHRAKPHA
jgi:hypothetical protein